MNDIEAHDSFTLARMFVASTGPVTIDQIADWLLEQCQSCNTREQAESSACLYVMYELANRKLVDDGDGYYDLPPGPAPFNPFLKK